MERGRDSISARLLPCAAAAILAIVMTWPLASGLGTLGRSSAGGDGLYSVWNVAWVARTLVTDPAQLYNANIFSPHRDALAFSEANLGAGIVAIPAWVFTHNAYTAHNVALLFAFATAWLGMFCLARRLTGDPWAAAIAAVLFGFCPYLFAHTAHIQLLMCGGIPLAMLLMHRLADAPSGRRGVALGLALAVQGLSCAYYGIFAGLMVGYAVLFLAVRRRLWRTVPYWRGVAVAAVTALAGVTPFFLPYLGIQEGQGFRRSLADSARYAANAQSYVASPAHAHAWLLTLTKDWERHIEPLFPGFVALALGLVGIVLAARARSVAGSARTNRETVWLYGTLGALAFWASFGPQAGLYLVLFRLPLFSFLRAPSRFGLLVVFALAVFAALAVAELLRGRSARVRAMAGAALAALALAELNVLPFPWERALPISPAYAALATMPRAPMAEFPFYGERPVFHLHTQHMLFSTAHWMPLVNGYSDHIPQDFREIAPALASFPSTDTFRLLAKYRVRYIGIHWDMYVGKAEDVRARLAPFAPYLRVLGSDEKMTLYEIVGFP